MVTVIIALIPDIKVINSRFLWLALRSVFCRNQFKMATGGQGKGEISEARLMDIDVPFPPLTVQQAIVEYWENNGLLASRLIMEGNNELQSIHRKFIWNLGLDKLKTPHSDRSIIISWRNVERWGVDISMQSTSNPNFNGTKYSAVRLGDVIKDLQNG